MKNVELDTSKDHIFWTIDEFRSRIGEEVGISDWLEITQERIDAFAALTGDDQFIHVDPDRARETPFGGTIAHGFYTLSVLSYLGRGHRPRLQGMTRSVNYGFDRVRFVSPVKVNSRIRARFRLEKLGFNDDRSLTIHWGAKVDIENEEQPALVADWIWRVWRSTSATAS